MLLNISSLILVPSSVTTTLTRIINHGVLYTCSTTSSILFLFIWPISSSSCSSICTSIHPLVHWVEYSWGPGGPYWCGGYSITTGLKEKIRITARRSSCRLGVVLGARGRRRATRLGPACCCCGPTAGFREVQLPASCVMCRRRRVTWVSGDVRDLGDRLTARESPGGSIPARAGQIDSGWAMRRSRAGWWFKSQISYCYFQ
jgi:hypothetical protein